MRSQPAALSAARLGGGVLFVGGDAGVANQHCINVSPILLITQYLFRNARTLKSRRSQVSCKTVRLCNEWSRKEKRGVSLESATRAMFESTEHLLHGREKLHLGSLGFFSKPIVGAPAHPLLACPENAPTTTARHRGAYGCSELCANHGRRDFPADSRMKVCNNDDSGNFAP